MAEISRVPELANDVAPYLRIPWGQRSWLNLVEVIRHFSVLEEQAKTLAREQKAFERAEAKRTQPAARTKGPPVGPLSALPAAEIKGPPPAKDKKKRKTKAEKSAAASATTTADAKAATNLTAAAPAHTSPTPRTKTIPVKVPPLSLTKPIAPKQLSIRTTTSAANKISVSQPKAGYTCHMCGQAGGQTKSHWKQHCPLAAAGVGSWPPSPVRTPPASPRHDSQSPRSSSTSRSASASATSSRTASAGKTSPRVEMPGRSIGVLAPGSMKHQLCKHGADCRKAKIGTCAFWPPRCATYFL